MSADGLARADALLGADQLNRAHAAFVAVVSTRAISRRFSRIAAAGGDSNFRASSDA